MTQFQSRAKSFGRYAAAGFAVFLAAAALSPAAQADEAPPALGWTGQIALGGSLATGNTDRQALDLDTKVQLQSEHRQDRFKVLGDLARENGVINAERTEAAAQSNYDISKDKFYVLGFTQYVRDRFSGFSYEAELGPGVGYRFVRTDRLKFSVELSGGYRHAALRGPAGHDDQIFTRGTATVEYKLSDNAWLANETLVTGDNERIKVEDTFSVTSTLIRNIAARIAINGRYSTSPPAGVKRTDTLSKMSLVYAF